MEPIELTQDDINSLEDGEVVTSEREDGNRVRIANYEADVDAGQVDLFVVNESLDQLDDDEVVEYEDSGYFIRRADTSAEPDESTDDSLHQEDMTESDENSRWDTSHLTKVDIDTSMLRELATGDVTIEISLDGDEWDKLAQGGSVETNGLYLTYNQ
jgi:hypothetical protein